MYCLTLTLNGQPLCAAGHADASFFDVQLHASVYDEPATLRVSGMLRDASGRSGHIYWIEELALQAGDTVTIQPQDLAEPTPPARVEWTDSPDYIANMQAYEAFAQGDNHPPAPRAQVRASVGVVHIHSRLGKLKAGIPLGQQHVLWTATVPRPARISTRTFSGRGKLIWLQDELHDGEVLSLRLAG